MSEEKIRKALEARLFSSPGQLPTVWQNKPPVDGFNASAPHQKAFLLPSENKSYGLKEKTTLHRGIFQVNLCYPSGTGAALVEARGAVLQAHFAPGTELTADGVKVRIRGKPSIAGPVSSSPYVVPVSIRYESIN